MRFFAGMTPGEATGAIGVPRRPTDRHWAFARAWLANAPGSVIREISDFLAHSLTKRGIGEREPDAEVNRCPMRTAT